MSTWYELSALVAGVGPRSLDAESDACVAALAEGDETALRTVYQHHHQAVRAFAQRLIGDEDQAEELVQEVFVALPRAIRRFRAESSLRSFLIGVAVNHAKHFVRAAGRRRAALQRLAREPVPVVRAPDEAMAREELADLLTRAMDRLPLEQRVAFVLSEVEEHGLREAAAMVGVSESTFRARVSVAKKKLREHLSELGLP